MKTYPVEGKPSNIRAIWKGEKRCPKKGEYYLSGGPASAWLAYEDLTTSYHIASLVEVETETVTTIKRHL